jgi:peptidyl-tRNA hydrolase
MNETKEEDPILRMYIVVNNDLGMGRGKVGGQVGHCVSAMIRYLEHNPNDQYTEWLTTGEAKIVVKATLKQMESLLAISTKFSRFTIHDAGKTQIAPDSFTALGILPCTKSELPELIKKLKLL